MEEKKLFGSRVACGNSAYCRKKSDFYPTPWEVTQALLNFLELRPGTRIWEPACGDGKMVDVLMRNGMAVAFSDISMGVDFLTADLPSGGGRMDYHKSSLLPCGAVYPASLRTRIALCNAR